MKLDQASNNPLAHKTRALRLRWPAVIIPSIVLALAAGCAPTTVQDTSETSAKLPRPDLILVYDFAVSPEEVKLDTGLSAELMDRYKKIEGASARTAAELKIGHTVAHVVADELVKRIKSYGLWAERALGNVQPKDQTLLVKGQFLSIDQGNRTERVVIGFGAGRTDVQANVQLYDITPKGQQEVESLKGTGASGDKPGMAEMAGLGAITHHLLTSLLVSGGISAAGEMSFETVEADGRRMADKIAANLGQFFVEQGWIPPSAVKSSSMF